MDMGKELRVIQVDEPEVIEPIDLPATLSMLKDPEPELELSDD
jgi:hypothetical protein